MARKSTSGTSPSPCEAPPAHSPTDTPTKPQLAPEVITRAQELKADGQNLREIAEQLNLEGFTTATGQQWSAATVHKLQQRKQTPGRPPKKVRGVSEDPPGSGKWWARWAGEDGKMRKHACTSYSAAVAFVEKMRTLVRDGNGDQAPLAKKHQWTVAQMCDHYQKKRAVGGEVRGLYADAWNAAYWTSKFGTIPLDKLTPDDLEEWRAHRLQVDKVKPATVNIALGYLKAYYQLAIRDKHCKNNPVRQIKELRTNNARIQYLREAQEVALEKGGLAHNPDWHGMKREHWLVVAFAFLTGLRREEQFTLSWANVNLEAGFIHLPKTKSGKQRMVPISSRVRAILDELKQATPTSPWVFSAPRQPSKRLAPGNFTSRGPWKEALKATGITDFHWHDLRHTFGSRLALKGVGMLEIMKLMGHSSLRQTERYAHLSPDHLRDAINRI